MDEEIYSTEGPTCPYCGEVGNPSDDPECYNEGCDEWTCGECDKDYSLSPSVSWSWTSKKKETPA